MDNDDELVQINLRLRRRDLHRIDARRAEVNRSRNSWIEAALRLVLDQPPQTMTTTTVAQEQV